MGGVVARAHAGTHPNIRLGAIDRAPCNEIFPLKRAMSHSSSHSQGKTGVYRISWFAGYPIPAGSSIGLAGFNRILECSVKLKKEIQSLLEKLNMT